MATSEIDVTQLLREWRQGNDEALERLLPVVYGELSRLASHYLRGERRDHTFETQDLIHEAFLRLTGQRDLDLHDRSHFFAISALTMRRVLVEHARSRSYAKRGGGAVRLSLADAPDLFVEKPADLVALDEALKGLSAVDEELGKLVELRFFGGFNNDQIAEITGVSNVTVRRRFRVAKAWLYRHLSREATDVH